MSKKDKLHPEPHETDHIIKQNKLELGTYNRLKADRMRESERISQSFR